MQKEKKKDFLHLGYRIALLIKGIDGILEFIGGILFMIISPQQVNKLIIKFTQHELSNKLNDGITTALVNFRHSLSLSTFQFDIIYLTIHGAMKVLLVSLLWQKKLWAFPICIIAFGLFIFYQLYRYSLTHSALALFLTAFDLLMIYMTIIEYKKALAEFKVSGNNSQVDPQ